MATENREDIQRAEKVALKRKLTGPPRLLLGKTRTRSAGDDRAETQTNKTKMAGGDDSSPKCSAAAESETAELTDSVSSEENVKSCGGRCGAAGEGDVIRNRKVNRLRWWRIFSPAAVCNRKQNKEVEKSSEKQKSDDSAPPQGALQETDTARLNNTEENTKRTKGMKRFKVRAWSTFERFLTSSNERGTHEQKRVSMETDDPEAPMTFRKKMQKFLTKGGKSRSSSVSLENMEDTTGSSAAQADEPGGEVVTVAVEMSVQLTEKRAAAETPDETPEEEQLVCDVTKEDLKDDVKTSEMIQNDSDVVEDKNNVPVKDLKVEAPEKHEVFWESAKVVLNAEDQLSPSTTSSQEAAGNSHALQPTTNGPSIRIELVPPDNVLQEEEEDEECWEGASSSENHLLLLLLGLEHRERQLLQTARSLVRAAMKAAVDQLTREQQSDSDCVHREPPGSRDHA